MLMLLLSGCAATPPVDVIKTLAINECVFAQQKNPLNPTAAGKDPALLALACEQQLVTHTAYQQAKSPRFQKSSTLTYDDAQEYYDQVTWDRIMEQMRLRYYPDVDTPERELRKAQAFNAAQNRLQDTSLARHYQPTLMPSSPYVMSYRQLGFAKVIMDELRVHEHDDADVRGKRQVINGILMTEIWKKEDGGR